MQKNTSSARAELIALRKEFETLEHRLQVIERELHPTRSAAPTVSRTPEIDDRKAERQAAIATYNSLQDLEFFERHPEIGHRFTEDRHRLNAFLRERGFEPEPDWEP